MNINRQPIATRFLIIDIKHQTDRVMVDVRYQCFFIEAKMMKSIKKICQNCTPLLESSYPAMQRKHIPKVSEYQS